MFNWTKTIQVGTITALLAVGGWVYATNQTRDDVEHLQKAVVKIAERQDTHITKDRYRECEKRCISVEECPAPDEALPRSRCEEG